MTRINLLPWREVMRKERKRQFASVAGGAALLMGVVVFYVHMHISGMISYQESRNSYLEGEIAQVDEKIKEIKEIENKKIQLLNRMNVIQDLQSQRPLVVRMLDEMVRVLPDGVYLTKLAQSGSELDLEGFAQSNARVSTFMRNLDASEWFKNPRLEVIDAKDDKDAGRISRFVLKVAQVTLSGTGDNDAEKDSKKNTGKSASKNKKGKRK